MIDWYYDPLPGGAFAAALHALRRGGAVVSARALSGSMPIYYILGHAALAAAFRDGDQFPPGHAYQIISLPFIGETFMSMNEAEHRHWRPPMTRSFRRSAIDCLDEGQLAQMGHDLLDRLEGESTADLVQSFTRRYAFRVICAQLGLPIAQEAEYYQWSMDLMFGGRDLAKSQAADARLTDMVKPVLEARKHEPQDDQISRWLHTEVDKDTVDESSILAHIRLFFTAGATTTSDAMGNLLHALLTHHDAWEHCVHEPRAQAGAIQELLRWNPPVAAQPRFTHPDHAVQLAGVEIPPNSPVLFGIAAANRDPLVFDNPDRFDISRKTTSLLSFGPGLRTCPGMHLAQRNLQTALRIITERLPRLTLDKQKATPPQGALLRGAPSLPVSWH
ncbi:MAG: cytochrome P450 [Halioglobus sp.]|nr:cytochrome P450 [Halioglobus sp.]